MKTRWSAVAVALAFLLAAGTVEAVPFIDTMAGWNGVDNVFPFGEPNTATYGQTFTVTGPETVLDNFTFVVNDDGFDITFEAFVYAWDAANFRATGPALFSSGPYSVSVDFDYENFMINTGGLQLMAGTQYVAFFSASNYFNGDFGVGLWAANQNANAYAGGQFVYNNNGANFGALFGTEWDTCNIGADCFQGRDGNLDSAFRMEFSNPVPEPATLTLLGAGLAGMALRRRRRS